MFTKVLIANRGEIACRIAKTCRSLGIKTVAVYSDADKEALHVQACDEAIFIGGSAPRESYLLGNQIIEQAIACGAEAIHPGYGFLSENADFAQACAVAGLVFIGPPATAIMAMGSKSAAKSLMEKAQVPLVPGYHGDQQEFNFLHKQADQIGYPVLLKASAGGGGKGMRIVQDSFSFEEALASCKREAMTSFGDDKVLVEKYLTRPRHIEVQVFADKHGNCVYLFDRDCSVQRRHQKVLEEAPAPCMSLELKQAMGEAAVNAAKAVNYEGAGTVEFIAEADNEGQAGQFYFMEMNTRLQVEHPVTEMITGQDLVEWQLRVAAGESLPLMQHELKEHGHALEARIYAENPENQFLPSTGTLFSMKMPKEERGIVRVDTGVREGDIISPFYDPMIAKLIVWGEDRPTALARMATALAQVNIVGLSSNVAFLGRLVKNESFVKPNLDTGLIPRYESELLHADTQVDFESLAFLVGGQLLAEQKALSAYSSEINSPWQKNDGWRMNGSCNRAFTFTLDDAHQLHIAHLDYFRNTLSYNGEVKRFTYSKDCEMLRIGLNARRSTACVIIEIIHPEIIHLFRDGRHQKWHYLNPLELTHNEEDGIGKLTAPMPGRVVSIRVQVGDQVKMGDSLLVVEAMKMEHTITAPIDGAIAEILFAEGEQVSEGDQLIIFVSST